MEQTQHPEAPPLRDRTYAWGDPAVTLAALPTMSGVDWLRAVAAGDLPGPPVLVTIGIETFTVVGEGRVELTLIPGEHHLNPIGTMHGGVIATLLDTVAACSVHTTLDQGIAYTSLDLSTRFIRPVTVATGRIRAEGSVMSRGSRTATAEARLFDARDRLLAHATSTCLVCPLATPPA